MMQLRIKQDRGPARTDKKNIKDRKKHKSEQKKIQQMLRLQRQKNSALQHQIINESKTPVTNEMISFFKQLNNHLMIVSQSLSNIELYFLVEECDVGISDDDRIITEYSLSAVVKVREEVKKIINGVKTYNNKENIPLADIYVTILQIWTEFCKEYVNPNHTDKRYLFDRDIVKIKCSTDVFPLIDYSEYEIK